MPKHSETRQMPYSAQQMYDLIADIGAYPKFLPWCAGARIRDRKQVGETEIIDADLVISFKVFREQFGSRVTLHPDDLKIDVEYIDGPFRYLNNHWSFTPLDNGGCEVDFFVDFEFKSAMLQAVIGVVFNEAMRRIVGAFESRAKELYG
ncbi:type II toxin-antitoxin system RatA family toxin [Neptunicoccus cionae]|uniref:type II toxin-antitoxin system RatA family toxin n=1 Tax=Neptunicoccus cionae TaxID=2035344 RepID=UPI000C75B771|nr:type II toxin-antitoxin system RatA family toxin [Amylibacter cionae]PLS20670.1 ubiquinone-binding protein [Amylibacter cionae]